MLTFVATYKSPIEKIQVKATLCLMGSFSFHTICRGSKNRTISRTTLDAEIPT